MWGHCTHAWLSTTKPTNVANHEPDMLWCPTLYHITVLLLNDDDSILSELLIQDLYSIRDNVLLVYGLQRIFFKFSISFDVLPNLITENDLITIHSMDVSKLVIRTNIPTCVIARWMSPKYCIRVAEVIYTITLSSCIMLLTALTAILTRKGYTDYWWCQHRVWKPMGPYG